MKLEKVSLSSADWVKEDLGMCVVHDHKDAFFTNIISWSSGAGTWMSVPWNSGP